MNDTTEANNQTSKRAVDSVPAESSSAAGEVESPPTSGEVESSSAAVEAKSSPITGEAASTPPEGDASHASRATAAFAPPLSEANTDNEATLPSADPSPEETIAKLKNQLLRTAADFDNFRKRARRDVEDTSRRAREQTVLELLPLVDNLERAVEAADRATDVQAVVSGVRMVLRSFTDIGARMRLERIDAVGEPFDPSIHDAVQQLPSAEPPGTVIAEVTPGYRLGDKLLRAALVVVASPPAEGEES